MSKKYDNDFKQMIIALAQSDHHTLASISQDYGVSTATISNWLAADKTDTIQNLSPKDILAMQHDMAELRADNDILKKALTILSKRK